MKTDFKLQMILIAICDYYQIEKKDLIEKCRKPYLVRARQMYFHFCNEFSNDNLTQMSEFIERDHSTATYSIQKIRVEKEIYEDVRNEIKGITEKLFKISDLVIEEINLLELSEHHTKSFI